jgi:hypothetical protein
VAHVSAPDPFDVVSVAKTGKRETLYLGDGSLMRASIVGPVGGSGRGRRYEWKLTIAEGEPEDWRAWEGRVASSTQRTDKAAREQCVACIVGAAKQDQDAIAVARRALEKARRAPS